MAEDSSSENIDISSHNKVFCSYLWTHICVRPYGKLYPCCSFKDSQDTTRLRQYVKGNSFDLKAAFNSLQMQEHRNKSLKEVPIKGCNPCYMREVSNGRSKRKLANEDYRPEFNSTEGKLEDVTFLELFIGNKCNLKCLICVPLLSTPLAHDYRKLNLVEDSATEIQSTDYSSFVSELPNLNYLKFVGGEPLIDKNHLKLIDSIDDDRAKDIALEYTTNCTTFPNQSILQLWKKFKKIYLKLSIDGIGPIAEYSRFPSRWTQIDENVHKYLRMKKQSPEHYAIGINQVISSLSIFSFGQTEEFIKENYGLSDDTIPDHEYFANVLTYPEHLNIRHFPEPVKTQLLELYPDNFRTNFFRETLKLPADPIQLKKLKGFLNSMDGLRSTKYAEAIPELGEILKNVEIDEAWAKGLSLT